MGSIEVGMRCKCSGGAQDSGVVRSAVCGSHSDGIVAVAVDENDVVVVVVVVHALR